MIRIALFAVVGWQCCCVSAGAQQLLSSEVVAGYKSVAPKTDDPLLQDVIDRGVWYTNAQMPQPSFVFANAKSFPWNTSLGGKSFLGREDSVKTAKILLTEEPVAVFGNNNEHWCFPKGAVVVELGWMLHEGRWYSFETRRRLREPDDWETDIIEPFPTRAKLVAEVAKTHPEIAEEIPKMPVRRFTVKSSHPRPSFDEVVELQKLPDMPLELVMRLHKTVVHESSAGVQYADDADGFYQTQSHFHLRPVSDVSAANGNGERESCRNCHRDIKQPAVNFGINEDWEVRGGDGIISFRPVLGGQLRADLVRLGLVAHWRDIPEHKRHLYQQSVFLIEELKN